MTTATDSTAEILKATERAAMRIRARANEADAQRALHAETVSDLHEAGALTMAVPRTGGGSEIDPVGQARVIETIASACASTAWCLGNHGVISALIRTGMDPLGGDPIIADLVTHGGFLVHATVPAGEVVLSDGGYRVSGRWPFISGSLQARWGIFSTMVAPQDGGSEPENRWLAMPMRDETVEIEETWRAMSVRASMSHDVIVRDAFVPQERTVLVSLPFDLLGLLGRESDPPALRVPFGTASAFFGALAIGTAQAAIDDTLAYAGSSNMIVGGRPEGSLRGNMPHNQVAIADALVANESGRAFFYQALGDLTATTNAREAVEMDQLMRLEMAVLHARESAQRAVDGLFEVRGAHGLFEDNSFERYYRDIRMVTLHAISAPSLAREQIAKHYLGIPADQEPRWG